MKPAKPVSPASETSQVHPWYRYAWPWVAIAIPGLAVVGGLFTLYLAISNPDPVIVDDQQYRELRADLTADPLAPIEPPTADTERERDRGDGDD